MWGISDGVEYLVCDDGGKFMNVVVLCVVLFWFLIIKFKVKFVKVFF